MAPDRAIFGGAAQRVPGPALVALGLFALVGLVAISPGQALPPAPVLIQRDLRFVLPADGSVDAIDAVTNRPAAHLAAGGQSFVQGMVHGLQVGRRRYGKPIDAAYHLALLADGRFTLTDPQTDTTVDLEGFGPNNEASFRAFLGAGW